MHEQGILAFTWHASPINCRPCPASKHSLSVFCETLSTNAGWCRQRIRVSTQLVAIKFDGFDVTMAQPSICVRKRVQLDIQAHYSMTIEAYHHWPLTLGGHEDPVRVLTRRRLQFQMHRLASRVQTSIFFSIIFIYGIQGI